MPTRKDVIRPQLTIIEANFLSALLRESINFAGLGGLTEAHSKVAEDFANRLDTMVEYWKARNIVAEKRRNINESA